MGSVPGLTVRPIESSCCGMAGAFGYQSETQEVSQAMACEWAAVPAYAQALESTEGKGAFDRLLASFEAASADLLGHARTLFERWFELVSPAAA